MRAAETRNGEPERGMTTISWRRDRSQARHDLSNEYTNRDSERTAEGKTCSTILHLRLMLDHIRADLDCWLYEDPAPCSVEQLWPSTLDQFGCHDIPLPARFSGRNDIPGKHDVIVRETWLK